MTEWFDIPERRSRKNKQLCEKLQNWKIKFLCCKRSYKISPLAFSGWRAVYMADAVNRLKMRCMAQHERRTPAERHRNATVSIFKAWEYRDSGHS